MRINGAVRGDVAGALLMSNLADFRPISMSRARAGATAVLHRITWLRSLENMTLLIHLSATLVALVAVSLSEEEDKETTSACNNSTLLAIALAVCVSSMYSWLDDLTWIEGLAYEIRESLHDHL